MKFCNFCDVNPHVSKIQQYIFTTQTVDGKGVCDTCYYYTCCVKETEKISPCENLDCDHRPKIIKESWLGYRKWKKRNK